MFIIAAETLDCTDLHHILTEDEEEQQEQPWPQAGPLDLAVLTAAL